MSRIHIERHGHGPELIVLLHGWGMHGGILGPLVLGCSLGGRIELHAALEYPRQGRWVQKLSTTVAG